MRTITPSTGVNKAEPIVPVVSPAEARTVSESPAQPLSASIRRFASGYAPMRNPVYDSWSCVAYWQSQRANTLGG